MAINPGSLASHRKWADKFAFRMPICADEGKKVAAAYGAVNLLGITKRSVFIVDKSGKVAWAKAGMPLTAEILAAIAAAS